MAYGVVNENNVTENGAVSEEEFTRDEKSVQYTEPECFPIEQLDLPEGSAGKKLTKKQIAFCRYYVSLGDVKKSAELAGYGKGTSLPAVARGVMRNPDVRAFISELSEKVLANMGCTKHQMIKTLAIIANHDVRDFLDIEKIAYQKKDGTQGEYDTIKYKNLDDVNKGFAVDEDGFELYDKNGLRIEIDTELTKAIKGVKVTDSGKINYEFYDKLQAIEKLSKMLGVGGKEQIEISSSEKIENTRASILDKLNKKLGNTPEIKVPADENEYYKEKQLEKKQAELFNQGLTEAGEGNE